MKAVLNIFGEISKAEYDVSAKDVQLFFDENKDAKEFEIKINSFGGLVFEGFAIADIIRRESGGRKVTTIAYSCMSIATVIFLAGDERLVSESSEFMIHNPWLQTSWAGEASDFEKIARDLRRLEDKVVSYYLKYTKTKEKELRDLMRVESTIEPEKLVEMGFATGILEPSPIAEYVQVFEKAVAYASQADRLFYNNNQNEMNSILEEIKEVKSTLAKALGNSKALKISMLNGENFDIDTKEQKASVGDSVSFEGAPVTDGDYPTAQTGEIFVIRNSKIEEIKEEEKEILFQANKVSDFIKETANQMSEAVLVKVQNLQKENEELKKNLEESFMKKEEFNTTIEDLKKSLEEAQNLIVNMNKVYEADMKALKASITSDPLASAQNGLEKEGAPIQDPIQVEIDRIKQAYHNKKKKK